MGGVERLQSRRRAGGYPPPSREGLLSVRVPRYEGGRRQGQGASLLRGRLQGVRVPPQVHEQPHAQVLRRADQQAGAETDGGTREGAEGGTREREEGERSSGEGREGGSGEDSERSRGEREI